MKNILVQIVRDKVQEVQVRKEQVPIEFLRDKAEALPKCRNFYKAVTKINPRGINVIAEVKKASPSAGLIREDFDAVAIAQTYEKCGADAISVLTDEKYFQGKLEYLTAVKEMVSIPVLRKDFIVDPYQIYEARAAGADAILLIAEALPSGLLMDLVIAANELTLSVLLEVHEADFLLKVRSMLDFPQKHYTVMGINNRNLNTMKVDINTTSRLAELIENKRQLVAESGIKTRQDVEKMIRSGVGAVLIGETLCASPDINAKFDELFNP
jgi:indole-3-glycerol phosphate synthase